MTSPHASPCLLAYPTHTLRLRHREPQVPLPEINFSPVEEVGSPILADLPLLHIAHPLGRWTGIQSSLAFGSGTDRVIARVVCRVLQRQHPPKGIGWSHRIELIGLAR